MQRRQRLPLVKVTANVRIHALMSRSVTTRFVPPPFDNCRGDYTVKPLITLVVPSTCPSNPLGDKVSPGKWDKDNVFAFFVPFDVWRVFMRVSCGKMYNVINVGLDRRDGMGWDRSDVLCAVFGYCVVIGLCAFALDGFFLRGRRNQINTLFIML